MENYYTLFGLDTASSNEQITQELSKLENQWLMKASIGDPKAKDMIEKIRAAQTVFANKENRAEYDRKLNRTEDSEATDAGAADSAGQSLEPLDRVWVSCIQPFLVSRSVPKQVSDERLEIEISGAITYAFLANRDKPADDLANRYPAFAQAAQAIRRNNESIEKNPDFPVSDALMDELNLVLFEKDSQPYEGDILFDPAKISLEVAYMSMAADVRHLALETLSTVIMTKKIEMRGIYQIAMVCFALWRSDYPGYKKAVMEAYRSTASAPKAPTVDARDLLIDAEESRAQLDERWTKWQSEFEEKLKPALETVKKIQESEDRVLKLVPILSKVGWVLLFVFAIGLPLLHVPPFLTGLLMIVAMMMASYCAVREGVRTAAEIVNGQVTEWSYKAKYRMSVIMPRYIWGTIGAYLIFGIISAFTGVKGDTIFMCAFFGCAMCIWVALLSVFLGSDIFLRHYEMPDDPLLAELDRRPDDNLDPDHTNSLIAETMAELLEREDISVARPEAFKAFIGMFGTDAQKRRFAKQADPYIQASRDDEDPVIRQASLCLWNCLPDVRRLYANREPIGYPLYEAALLVHCSEYPSNERDYTKEAMIAEIDPKCDLLAEKYYAEFSTVARKNGSVPGQRLWAYILGDHRRSEAELGALFCPYTSDLYNTGKMSKNIGRTPKQIFLIVLIVLAYISYIALAIGLIH